jgi:hypothetical protein
MTASASPAEIRARTRTLGLRRECVRCERVIGMWWARQDSNLQPRDYESPAPPLSYGPLCVLGASEDYSALLRRPHLMCIISEGVARTARHLSFLGSSMVEHPAVNRRVVGSSPTRGARVIPGRPTGRPVCYLQDLPPHGAAVALFMRTRQRGSTPGSP